METIVVNNKNSPIREKKASLGETVLTRKQGPTGKTTSVILFVIIFVSKAATVAPGVLKCLTDLTISKDEVKGVVKVVVNLVLVLVVSSRPCLLVNISFYPDIRYFIQEFTRMEGFLCFKDNFVSKVSIFFINPDINLTKGRPQETCLPTILWARGTFLLATKGTPPISYTINKSTFYKDKKTGTR